jgi:hypothetical protein
MNLQLDPDYVFEEVPMPYNINIQTENAGKKEAKYTVIPSPKRIPLTEEEQGNSCCSNCARATGKDS